MGRLTKSEENNARFANVQYTKLKDEHQQQQQYTGSGESPEQEQVMPGFEGYISFSCRQCGHLQIFQGAELEMILGKSLKMAFRSNKKDQQTNNTQSSTFSFDQRSSDVLSKNNIPMAIQNSYQPYQETLDGSSIGIPVVSGLQPIAAARSGVSSDESNSPTQLNQFKRLVEKPSLMKRIGKGFVLSGSDEEGYPLVSDGSSSIPGSQSNISLLNADAGGTEAATIRIGDTKEGSLKCNQSKTSTSDRGLQYGDSGSSSVEEIELKDISTENAIFKKKEANLSMAPWYQEGIPREIALEILSQEPIGSFMVRRSTTKIGCFALSVRVPRSFQPRGIAHYLIMRTNKGYRIKGFTKDFPTIASLIAHHSVMPELLPCPLSLSRYHPVCVISDCRRDFADIEPEPDG